MLEFARPYLVPLLASLLAGLILTPAVRALATRAGMVAHPTENRWSRRPVALMGGAAMVCAFFAGLAVARLDAPSLAPLVVYTSLMFLLGAADDLLRLRPATKLAGQLALAAIFIAMAPRATLTGIGALDTCITFVWLVGIANAFNLLDNMDGLSAGVALFAGTSYLAILVAAGQEPIAIALAAFLGSVAAFLVYNFQPASIFMGDGGSFYLGSVLGGATLLAAPALHSQLASIAIVPVLILLIPIFDTTFVTLTRGLAGRSALVGGRDHTSHRLVALGISERRAVLSLYALAAAGGLVAVAVHRMGLASGIVLMGIYLTVLLAVGVVLGHVDAAAAEPKNSETLPLVSDLTYRYRLYEVALDAAVIAVAYYAAFRIRFQEPQFSGFLPPFLESFPLVVGCQVAGLWLSGKYRQVWRHFGAAELMYILRGILFGVAGSVILMVYLYRFEGFSRLVFLTDSVLLSFLLVGSRVAIGYVDDYLRRERSRGHRTLIFGAGRAGALLLRELLQNQDLELTPVGFVDDDPQKHRLKIDGLPVLGGVSHVAALIERLEIEQIVIGIRDLPQPQLSRLLDACRDRHVLVRRMRLSLEDIDSGRPAIRAIHHGR
jgi:UDP-GlcNAc:undecaprenyl-phosphate/decaprenyl-phosphate GlcNAc-1-phosphate transferase